MKLRWKDFLYFQQSDKNAIVLLCVLIAICCGICIFSEDLFPDNKDKDNTYINFVNYQKNPDSMLPDVDRTADPDIPAVTKPQNTLSKKLSKGETIDINSASFDSFKRIPGIGDEYARRIVNYRDILGGFVSTEQLMEIQGISQKKYDKISGYLVLRKKHKLISVNKLENKSISKHPYLSDNLIKSILDYRQKGDRIASIDELSSLEGFSPRDIDRLAQYLSFD